MLRIPIDTGNKAIKTENFEFHSGITALESMPGENEEALMFQDKYYRLSHERNVYLPDKTLDDRYYLLTLVCNCKRIGKAETVQTIYSGGTDQYGASSRASAAILSESVQKVQRLLLSRGAVGSFCIYGKVIPLGFL